MAYPFTREGDFWVRNSCNLGKGVAGFHLPQICPFQSKWYQSLRAETEVVVWQQWCDLDNSSRGTVVYKNQCIQLRAVIQLLGLFCTFLKMITLLWLQKVSYLHLYNDAITHLSSALTYNSSTISGILWQCQENPKIKQENRFSYCTYI